MEINNEKLEYCEVCAANAAKYTCPKCEVRTCGLTCVNIHKKELDCDGIRDNIKYVPLNKFTDLDLLSDYRLLESIGRSVENLQANPKDKFNNYFPAYLKKLKHAAFKNNIDVRFLPNNFSRHKENTTYLKYKTKELFWRVEFIFPQAENVKWSIKRVLETRSLFSVLEEVFDQTEEKTTDVNLTAFQKKIQIYKAEELSHIKLLLKAEKIQKSSSRFYELDLSKSLQENLRNKTVIEFPTILVILKDHISKYEIIDNEVEIIHNSRKRNFKNMNTNRENKNKIDYKKQKISTPNYFFNSEDLGTDDDSENDDIGNRCSVNTNTELDIPTYNDLVKM